MDTENAKNQIRTKTDRLRNVPAKVDISNGRLKSGTADAQKAPAVEVPNIRLAPEQIEEIHTDEYSLTLFYATRIEPMSAADIKREFPEPEPKKAQSVMDRFVKVGLVHITSDGKYYSNFPENYINYSHYRYDGDLEARKDAKVFRLMKEFTGIREYWKNKTYFSMDAFYTDEQTAELQEMFRQIKLKAKEYANDNAKKKSTKGMKFRRMKFFDMNLALVLAFVISCFGMMNTTTAFAGGNDPHAAMLRVDPDGELNFLRYARMSGGGNDPTMRAAFVASHQFANILSVNLGNDELPGTPGGGGHDPSEPTKTIPDDNGGHDPIHPKKDVPTECGGGGHDPTDNCPVCVLEIEGTRIHVQSPSVCKLKRLLDFVARCGMSQHPACVEASRQIEDLLLYIQQGEGRAE